MSRFLSDRFAGMEPYVPGEQPQNRQYVKLNTNESPFPPAPGVLDAISHAEAERLNLYPDPDTRIAADEIAAYFGVKRENVLLGNGSDELLSFCFQAFCDEKTHACFADITYGFYEVFARVLCVPSRVIPLDDGLRIRPSDYLSANGTVFLANPNAPTGIALPLSGVERILQNNMDHVVIVDEAYAAFGTESAAALIDRYPNLLVVMTMSKSHALAGLRIGLALGQPQLIDALTRIKDSFNSYPVDMLAQHVGAAALLDTAYYDSISRRIMATRERTTRRLQALGFDVLPSSSNFLFASKPGLSAAQLKSHLEQHRIYVRHFNLPRTSEYLRITIGTDEQMDALLRCIGEL